MGYISSDVICVDGNVSERYCLAIPSLHKCFVCQEMLLITSKSVTTIYPKLLVQTYSAIKSCSENTNTNANAS